MDLSIIIVNYKTPKLLANCLRTVYEQTTDCAFEIVVVDNASNDNSQALITTAFPAVRWVQLDYNAGFARANNAGIRQSTGKAVLLLNSDTLVEDRAIDKCYQQLMTSGYVACGVQLLNPDRTPQISGNYFMKGGLNYLLPLPYIGIFIKWLGTAVKVQKPNVPEATSLVEVDWVNGAYLMVKRAAIEHAGLLDEDFFLYSEEAEWCSRLKKYGKLCIFGELHIIHLQGETANETFGSTGKGYFNLYDRKGLQIMLSNFVRVRKQFGIGWYLFLLGCYTAAVPIFFVGSFLHHLFSLRNPFRDFPRAARFSRNIGKLWTFLPTILLGKPYFYKVL